MTYFRADHYTELTLAEAAEWELIAPNFLPKELASKGDGSLLIYKPALRALQRVRHLYGKPLTINSAYRDPVHNRSDKVGSNDRSQHLKGVAFDIAIDNGEMGRELELLAKQNGFTAIGRYNTFIHIDMRPPKSTGGFYHWGLAAWD